MPGLDRTGPRGEGPRTGRQMGRCAPRPKKKNEEAEDADNNDSRIENGEDLDMDRFGPFRGRGLGRGAGGGLGRGTGRGTGRGMGRGVGRHRRRKRGN